MGTKIVLLALLIAVSPAVSAADSQYTPALGSPERRAICDDVRSYVLQKYASGTKMPQPIIFRIDRIKVLGNYCSFKAIPLFKDGSFISTDYIADVAFDLCLTRTDGNWHVIYDFSRTDVPDDTELRQIWSVFPKEFPFLLLPKFWREHFERIK